MYNVSTEIYEETASRLGRAARGEEFFSGSIVARDGEYDLRLTATVIVVYGKQADPKGPRIVEDMLPVWWEFHTYLGGEEVLNDFSFGDLRACLR